MQWASAGEFFAMGGYALYVWGSFGVCLALMIIEPLMARHRQQLALQELARERLAAQLNEEMSAS